MLRHSSPRGFEAKGTRKTGRDADRASAIRTLSQHAHASDHGRRRSAARATRRASVPPGIVSRPDDAVTRIALPAELRRIRLAEQHHASVAQAFGEGRVKVRDPVDGQQRPPGGADPARRRQILQRTGYAG